MVSWPATLGEETADTSSDFFDSEHDAVGDGYRARPSAST